MIIAKDTKMLADCLRKMAAYLDKLDKPLDEITKAERRELTQDGWFQVVVTWGDLE